MSDLNLMRKKLSPQLLASLVETRMKKTFRKIELLLLNNSTIVLFVSIFLIFSILSPKFFAYSSLENIVKQASYVGILAVGMTFVLLTAGIDLSVGSNMYLSGVVAGLAIQNFGLPVYAALMLCLLCGFAFGWINSLLITRLKIFPFVATLGTMVAGRGLALLLTKSQAVSFPDRVIRMGSIRVGNLVPLPIVIFALVVLVAYLFLSLTQTGRQIYAVGNDPKAAQKDGIRSYSVLQKTYIICGLLAALGGFISVAQLGIINAGFGQGDEFDAIAAAVLGGASLFGGVGSVFPGTVLGAILIQMISSGLVFTQVNIYLQPLFMGAIIFIAVLLDSGKNARLEKMRKRTIRVEE